MIFHLPIREQPHIPQGLYSTVNGKAVLIEELGFNKSLKQPNGE